MWAATCVEIIFRDLTIKPIFVGLFLGGEWADPALDAMLRGRWVQRPTRAIAKDALRAVAGIDVDTFDLAGVKVWDEVPALLEKRNHIVHSGDEADRREAERAVDTAAGLYASILPPLRDLCGVTAIPGYEPPEGGV